jgi:cytochrome c oxidase assembly factor CtaG
MLPAFGWQAVLTRWEFAPAVTSAVIVAGALYLWGARRVARRHPARPWPWWRASLFLAGLAVVVLATQSGIGAYDGVLFWDHMIQHLMLIMIAPPLLVAGQPFTLLLHASRNPLHTWAKRAMRSRVVSFLTWPPFGLAAYVMTVVGTHLTALTSLIQVNPLLHDAEHALYLAVGYLFFLPILGREPIRWRLSYPIRILVLVLAMPVDTFTGLVLGYAGRWFATGSTGPRPPGSPGTVEDVHWAGAAMWIAGDAIMLAFIMLVVLMWSRDDRTVSATSGWLESVRRSRFDDLVAAGSPPGAVPAVTGPAVAGSPSSAGAGGRGIDDDEHLAAYNAYLARLHGNGGGGPAAGA